MKKRIYIDMDDTICDFSERYHLKLNETPEIKYPQSQYGFFTSLKPIDKQLNIILDILSTHYDVWIATRPSHINPLCYTEKRIWIEQNLGIHWCNRLIIIPDKSLLKGDYLIDDKPWPEFEGEQLLFGSDEFPSLSYCLKYLISKCNDKH